MVIDTVGFGDPNYPENVTLELFAQALRLVNNKVDLVLFVGQQGRINMQTINFFNMISKDLLTEQVRNNLAFVCSKCKEGWLEKNRALSLISTLLDKCNNKSMEFYLKFSDKMIFDPIFDVDYDSFVAFKNKQNEYDLRIRQTAIDKLIAFLRGVLPHEKYNMDYVQTSAFKKSFILKLKDFNRQQPKSIARVIKDEYLTFKGSLKNLGKFALVYGGTAVSITAMSLGLMPVMPFMCGLQMAQFSGMAALALSSTHQVVSVGMKVSKHQPSEQHMAKLTGQNTKCLVYVTLDKANTNSSSTGLPDSFFG